MEDKIKLNEKELLSVVGGSETKSSVKECSKGKNECKADARCDWRITKALHYACVEK